jgi:hypothetical protein
MFTQRSPSHRLTAVSNNQRKVYLLLKSFVVAADSVESILTWKLKLQAQKIGSEVEIVSKTLARMQRRIGMGTASSEAGVRCVCETNVWSGQSGCPCVYAGVSLQSLRRKACGANAIVAIVALRYLAKTEPGRLVY